MLFYDATRVRFYTIWSYNLQVIRIRSSERRSNCSVEDWVALQLLLYQHISRLRAQQGSHVHNPCIPFDQARAIGIALRERI